MEKAKREWIIGWSVFMIVCLWFFNRKDNSGLIALKMIAIWIVGMVLINIVIATAKAIKLSNLKKELEQEERRLNRLQWEHEVQLNKMKLQENIQRKIDRASELSEIINKTTDRDIFFSGLYEIKSILKELTKYEGTVDFVHSPSADLKSIEDSEYEQIKLLECRIREEQKSIQYDCMEGHDFEKFCAGVLEKNGFSNISVTPGSGDQGVDIIACKDGVKYGIQCKCYSSDIGNKAVQEVYSGARFYDCHVPVVLTNRYFTKSARELAEKTNVLLWDRDKLNDMINSG
jgi:HJR/Mrr/RecB family endonuclease